MTIGRSCCGAVLWARTDGYCRAEEGESGLRCAPGGDGLGGRVGLGDGFVGLKGSISSKQRYCV